LTGVSLVKSSDGPNRARRRGKKEITGEATYTASASSACSSSRANGLAFDILSSALSGSGIPPH